MKFELKDRLWIDGKILYECEGYVDNQPYTLYDKEEKDIRIPVSVDTGSNVNLLVASLIEIRTMEEHIVLYAGGNPVSEVCQHGAAQWRDHHPHRGRPGGLRQQAAGQD